MKKIFVCFAMIAMIFLVACGDDSSLYESAVENFLKHPQSPKTAFKPS